MIVAASTKIRLRVLNANLLPGRSYGDLLELTLAFGIVMDMIIVL